MARFKKYIATLVLNVDPDAPFMELENGENIDVVLEYLKDVIYDLDDMKLREIEVEYVEED